MHLKLYLDHPIPEEPFVDFELKSKHKNKMPGKK